MSVSRRVCKRRNKLILIRDGNLKLELFISGCRWMQVLPFSGFWFWRLDWLVVD